MRNLLLLSLAGGVLTVSISAQTPPAPAQMQDPDRFEKVHEGVFGQKEDKAAAAVRLTEAVAMKGSRGPAQPIARRNFIDEMVFSRIERDKVPHSPLATDEEFIRRIYMDAVGQLPTPAIVRSFAADRDPAKRDKVIDSLIGSDAFADHWSWYWGDLFRANQDFFTFYNRQWLKADRPYNEVFFDIVTAMAKEGHSIPATGFYHGANYDSVRALSPTDPDNYHLVNRLDFLDEVTTDITRVFLGMNSECISCHNGAGHLNSVNLYLAKKTRADFASQAAFFGKMRLVVGWSDRVLNISDENSIYDNSGPGYNTKEDGPFYTPAENRFPRNGKTYEPSFLLNGEKPKAGENPRWALGRIVPEHIQFSRAAVNLVWGRLMTVGFVDPYDSFDLDRVDPKNPPPAPWTIQPTNPELLDALAMDFKSHNFSIQTLMKTIMKSNAYQLSTQFDGEWKDSYVPYYSRRFARVMTGPEAADAIAAATNRPYQFNMRGETVSKVQELAIPESVSSARGANGKNEGVMVSAILQAFFQSKRQTPATLGNTASSIQAMLMMVSPAVTNRVTAEQGSRLATLLGSSKADGEILEELWLASLARRPTDGEVTAAKHLLARDRKTGFEDIQWALLNSPEFLVNH